VTNEFDNHFGIRLTAKLVTHALQVTTQFIGIVNRPIVHERNLATRIHVRMRILIRLATVCGPTRMRNAHRMSNAEMRMRPHQFNRIGLVAIARVLGQDLFSVFNSIVM
jgi:hypothetical protein